MTWLDLHRASEQAAARAHEALRRGGEDVEALFLEAALLEEKAFRQIVDKPRTLGVIAVSTAALFYKANDFERAEQFCFQALAGGRLPDFASAQIRETVSAIWEARDNREKGVNPIAGRLLFSVRGNDVVHGGAPVDLIISKIQTAQNIMVRVAEFLNKIPHRVKGGPSRIILDAYKPWLFQAAPGSYRFAVSLQSAAQGNLFPQSGPTSDVISSKVMEVLSSIESGQGGVWDDRMDDGYRSTFLKLARNLAPTGRSDSSVQVRSESSGDELVLSSRTRYRLNEVLDSLKPRDRELPTEIHGILRGVHLDKNWLEVTTPDDKSVRVKGLTDVVDDVIGPLVNNPVVVRVVASRSGFLFRDIEADG